MYNEESGCPHLICMRMISFLVFLINYSAHNEYSGSSLDPASNFSFSGDSVDTFPMKDATQPTTSTTNRHTTRVEATFISPGLWTLFYLPVHPSIISSAKLVTRRWKEVVKLVSPSCVLTRRRQTDTLPPCSSRVCLTLVIGNLA